MRSKLLRAVCVLPKGDNPEAKRKAVVPWRRHFIEMMFARKPDLRLREDNYLANLVPGSLLECDNIRPVLVPCETREDYDIYDYFRMWSSFPTVDRPGRRLKFLVRDYGQLGHPLMGLCCLSSAVRQLRVRDEWIGWNLPHCLRVRARNLAYILDLSTCVSVPPYSYLTVGKLLAGMMASNEVREIYYDRYCCRRSLARRRILTDFVLLTTSGSYGRNAPQYKGLWVNGSKLFQFIGYSRGYSTFQIPQELYQEVKAFVFSRRKYTDATVAGGANAKMRILRFAARELMIPEERLVFSGHRRAIFAAPLASNWREYLLGGTKNIAYLNYPIESIAKGWKEAWLCKRVTNSSVVERVRLFQPEYLRLTNLLKN